MVSRSRITARGSRSQRTSSSGRSTRSKPPKGRRWEKSGTGCTPWYVWFSVGFLVDGLLKVGGQIPGVTVPLSHLPTLLLALASAGVVHEAGHALTASIASIPLLSTGFHLHLLFPTFYVSLPSEHLDSPSMPGGVKARIAAAGAWHNLLAYSILALLGSRSGLWNSLSWTASADGLEEVCRPDSCKPSAATGSSFWTYLGFSNVAHTGVMVTSLDPVSPLYGHLEPGSVIKAVDDVPLGVWDGFDKVYLGTEYGIERWTKYLSLAGRERQQMMEGEEGWCVPETWFSRTYATTPHIRPRLSDRFHSTVGRLLLLSAAHPTLLRDVLLVDQTIYKRHLLYASFPQPGVSRSRSALHLPACPGSRLATF